MTDIMEKPGDVKFNKLVLHSIDGKTFDLRNDMIEMCIYEDIYAASTSGYIVFNDLDDLINTFPIVGHEILEVDAGAAGIPTTIKKKFQVYKVDKRTADNNKPASQSYILRFISFETINNFKSSVSRSWKSAKSVDIVSDIYNDYIQYEDLKLLIVEDSLYTMDIVFPNLKPFDCINWLASRTLSREFKSANYLFFENRYGFNFRSLSSMVSQDVDKQSLVNVDSVNARDDLHFILKPVEASEDLGHVGVDKLAEDLRTVQALSIEKNFDVLDNLRNGMYSSKLITHDVFNKSWGENVFSYIDDFENLPHLENEDENVGQVVKMLASKTASGYCLNETQRLKLFPMTPNVNQWMMQRKSQLQQFQNIVVNIKVAGDPNRTVGTVVYLDLPSMIIPDVNARVKEQEKYYAGKYLITRLQHIFSDNSYNMNVQLAKDSLKTPMPEEVLNNPKQNTMIKG
jgi:hypothetical protein